MATVEINPLEIIEGLEEKCWQCSDQRELLTRLHVAVASPSSSQTIHVPCDICQGKGYTLTDAGRAMLAFLERWKG